MSERRTDQQAILDRSLEDAAKIARRLAYNTYAHNAATAAIKLVGILRKLGAQYDFERE